MQGGYKPTATDWNNTIPGVCTYINNNIAAVLNVLTAKGDFYVYDGTALRAQTVGSNNKVLQADSTTNTGLSWNTYTGAAPLTTKGDLAVCNGSIVTRVGIGTDGFALQANSSDLLGVTWTSQSTGSQFPKGSVFAWSPIGAGTSTVPAGFVLCDGSNGTPNLIGLFVIGTRPNGSTSTPAPGGFGAYTVDAAGSGSKTHSHSVTSNATTTSPGLSGSPAYIDIVPGSTVVNNGNPAHEHDIPSAGGTSGAPTVEPSDYVLVYIMRNQ
jgi:hypothetical protein